MVLELVNQSIAAMASCFDSFFCKPRSNNATTHVNRARVSPGDSNFITCPHGYKSAVADILILIAVIGSSGYLLYPCLRSIFIGLVETIGSISDLVREEFCDAPLIYASIGLSVFCSGLATWALVACTSNKCGNPNCKGLRKAAEFDIQLETEELVKNSSENNGSFNNKCVFELPMNHHRELQAELKKMAPPNGRAVLVFRARCGCSAGRLEVPGPKKSRKIKK